VKDFVPISWNEASGAGFAPERATTAAYCKGRDGDGVGYTAVPQRRSLSVALFSWVWVAMIYGWSFVSPGSIRPSLWVALRIGIAARADRDRCAPRADVGAGPVIGKDQRREREAPRCTEVLVADRRPRGSKELCRKNTGACCNPVVSCTSRLPVAHPRVAPTSARRPEHDVSPNAQGRSVGTRSGPRRDGSDVPWIRPRDARCWRAAREKGGRPRSNSLPPSHFSRARAGGRLPSKTGILATAAKDAVTTL
jgi:hypothetical protein